MATSYDFYLKRHDTRPSLVIVCKDGNSTIVDLSTATSCRFHLRDSTGSVLVDKAAVVSNASAGELTYNWSTGDTDRVGTFYGEFEVFFGGERETFPNTRDLIVKVTADIA